VIFCPYVERIMNDTETLDEQYKKFQDENDPDGKFKDKFTTKEWKELFLKEKYGIKWWKLLTGLESELFEKFVSDPKWSELFTENLPNVDLLRCNLKLVGLFAEEGQGWAKNHEKWWTFVGSLISSLKPDASKQSEFRNLLLNRVAPDFEWAELFVGEPKKIQTLFSSDNINLIIFLLDDPKIIIELYPKWNNWISIFKDDANFKKIKFLTKNDSLKTLLLRKPGCLALCSENINYVEQLANDSNWKSLINDSPEWALVFATECEEINKRREEKKQTKVNKDSVGLAFSGGGIRSATFSLGVLEALRDFGLLKKVDYLSTVSGGGYIGAWLSANCLARDDNDDAATNKWLDNRKEINKEIKEAWDDSIKHLRRYSNYLSPQMGLFSADTWTLLTVWLRNTLLVQLTLFFFIASILLLPRIFFYIFQNWPSFYPIWRSQEILYVILGIVGMANFNRQLNNNRKETSKFFQNKDTDMLHNLFWAVFWLIAASLIYNNSNFNFFPEETIFIKNSLKDFIYSCLMALCLLLSGFYFLPLFWKIFKIEINYSSSKIDYSQGNVQKFVVLPMMAISLFASSTLWKIDSDNQISKLNLFSDFVYGTWSLLPVPLIIVLISLFMLSFCCIKGIEPKPNEETIYPSDTNKWFKKNRQKFNKIADKKCPFENKRITFELIWLQCKAIIYAVIASVVLYVVLSAIIWLLHDWQIKAQENILDTNEIKWRAFVWVPSLIILAFSFAILILLGMLGRDSTEGVREWWSRLGAWFLIYGFGWILITVVTVYGPLWGLWLYYDDSWRQFSVGAGWIGSTLAGLWAGKSPDTNGTSNLDNNAKFKNMIAKITPVFFITGLFIVISTMLYLLIVANSTDDNFKFSRNTLLGNYYQLEKKLDFHLDAKSKVHIDVSAEQATDVTQSNDDISHFNKYWELLTKSSYSAIWLLFVGCVIALGIFSGRIDINEFSFNGFYRSRLTRCFLGATRQKSKRDPQNFTGFDENDDLPLPDLLKSNGPFHIVNCALNLGGSKDLTVHTRHSALFTLTPLFCGSSYKSKTENKEEEIGYTATKEYGGASNQPTLGQAIAVSGAAASPNMGYHTSPITAFLLTVFNVRLGWWFPNPLNNIKRAAPLFSFRYLVMELFGVANERRDFLAISDGGHFENLAAYELVKRKCKVIIISDGECDPNMQFEGLANLIQLCEVDFGVEIDIDVRSIKPERDSPWSRSRCAIGDIIYDRKNKEDNGVLIYIKASMNGKEDTAVMQYKATHPTFPHETTGDQFYSENQFESYRRLGRDITERTFGSVMLIVKKETGCHTTDLENIDFVECAKNLKNTFSPELPNIGQFSRHTDRLMELWREINKNQSLKALDEQLNKGWQASASHDKQFRTKFYYCSELIQLMENVYTDLNLEETWEHPDNEGWRTLFIQWANSDMFKKTWEMTNENYGLRFRFFCKRHLYLNISVATQVFTYM
jgi:hypothetical protein